MNNRATEVQDFENYFLVYDVSRGLIAGDLTVSHARRAPKVNVATYTIDEFATGSHAIPSGKELILTAAELTIATTPTASVKIEGFTDSVGSRSANMSVSQDRGEEVSQALHRAGVDETRTYVIARGANNFIAANDTEANRAKNRRVVITIDRPGP